MSTPKFLLPFLFFCPFLSFSIPLFLSVHSIYLSLSTFFWSLFLSFSLSFSFSLSLSLSLSIEEEEEEEAVFSSYLSIALILLQIYYLSHLPLSIYVALRKF
jgi:hypothetical protein